MDWSRQKPLNASSPGQDVVPDRGRRNRSNFKKWLNHAGMLLKTKERCGKSRAEAGMLLITKEILSGSGNLIENKGESDNLVYPS
jgi:hypothetical protein